MTCIGYSFLKLGDRYRHYKNGKTYEILKLVTISSDDELDGRIGVVYQEADNKEAMEYFAVAERFTENVIQPRFEKV